MRQVLYDVLTTVLTCFPGFPLSPAAPEGPGEPCEIDDDMRVTSK